MEDQFSQPMQRARAAVRALHRLETLTRTSSARRARLSDANQPPLDGGAAVPLDVNAPAGEGAERASSWNPGKPWEHAAVGSFPDRVTASQPRLAVPATGLLAQDGPAMCALVCTAAAAACSASWDLCACGRMRWSFWRAEELRLRTECCLHLERHPRTVGIWLSPHTHCLTVRDIVRLHLD